MSAEPETDERHPPPEADAVPPPADVTLLLQTIKGGDSDAANDLLPLVYAELRRLAESRMARLPPGQTLQPTALVHEAYLELIGGQDPGWNGRGHFFGAAAQAMRELLVDQARRKSRQKRGGDRARLELTDNLHPKAEFDLPAEDMLRLDESLERLKEKHPRKAEVVMLRYFAGLTAQQTSEVLGVSSRTVEREWRFARAWLHKELAVGRDSDAASDDAE